MKKLNLAVLLFAFVIFYGCGSNTQKNTSETDKKNDKTTTENKTTDTKSDKMYSSIGKVEDAPEKKSAPNFTWTENGKEMSIKDLKGKVVVVNMWATWCGPCIKEMPDLSKISEEMKDKDFKLLGLNVFQQEGTKSVDEFLKSNPLSYWVVDGNEQVVNAFSKAAGSEISAVPTTFVIDKNGKIVETLVGSRSKEDFTSIINKYL